MKYLQTLLIVECMWGVESTPYHKINSFEETFDGHFLQSIYEVVASETVVEHMPHSTVIMPVTILLLSTSHFSQKFLLILRYTHSEFIHSRQYVKKVAIVSTFLCLLRVSAGKCHSLIAKIYFSIILKSRNDICFDMLQWITSPLLFNTYLTTVINHTYDIS